MAGITDAERLKRRATPKEVLDSCDSTRMWKKYLDSDDEKVSLDAWKYLHDRVYGKPKQAVDLGGEVELIKRVVSDL